MPTILDSLNAAQRKKIADTIEAASPEDRAQLLDVLMPLVQADAEKRGKKGQRLAKMQAAQSDPKYRDVVFFRTSHELKRLGLDINALAADDNGLDKLNKAMSEAKWDGERRMTLKTAAYAIGLIE